VWKRKKKALAQLYGAWEDSFKLLFSWREAGIEKMSYSVTEIEPTVEDDEKLYFPRFFCAFGPCLQDFCEGCMSYLSVDSTTLNS
jgi:hypothetical protein